MSQPRSVRRAVVFGEALIDRYPDGRRVGGAPLHVAAHLAATGWRVEFITRVGADRSGGRIVAELRARGVETLGVEMDHDLPTGEVTVIPGRGFQIPAPAAYDEIHGPHTLPDHSLFCYGTLAARAPTSRSTLQRLIASAKGLLALDANLRPPHFSRSVVAPLVARAQLIKATAAEWAQIAGLLSVPASPPALFGANRSLRWLCVTRGAAGAELFSSDGRRWSQRGPSVDVVDTVGAGDAFFARLSGAIAAGFSEEAALQAATTAAESVLSHRGGLPRQGPAVP